MKVEVYKILDDGTHMPFFGNGFIGSVKLFIHAIQLWWESRS